MRAFIVRPFQTKRGIDFDRVEAELIAPALEACSISRLMPIRLAQLALDVVSGPSGVRAAVRPGFPYTGQGAGPLRVRGGPPPSPPGVPVAGFARLDRRRAPVAAFRSPPGLTARYPRPTHKML